VVALLSAEAAPVVTSADAESTELLESELFVHGGAIVVQLCVVSLF